MSVFEIITILMALAAAFTLINLSFIKLPSTLGLMIIALAMSGSIFLLSFIFPSLLVKATHIMEEFEFQEVLLDIMLNFLLFAGAMSTNLQKLKEQSLPIVTLAIAGTLLSTFIVGTLMFYAFQILGHEVGFIYCLLFGALISPTDPIAVLALVKKVGMSKNLEIKIAGESLFNDGVGVVVFLTILGIAQTGIESFDVGEVGLLFGQEVIGGLLMGAFIGYVGFRLLDFIDNEHVELEVLVTVTMVMIGGRIAEMLHVSAPLAMVVMGLFVGNQGREEKLASATGEYVFKFWHLLDETLNAMLFILIGMEVLVISEKFHSGYITLAIVAYLVVLLARYIGVSIPVKLLSRVHKFEPKTIPILTWGGLRGGISIALALSLSDLEWMDNHASEVILFATYGIVVVSILLQGLTMERLIKGKPKNQNEKMINVNKRVA